MASQMERPAKSGETLSADNAASNEYILTSEKITNDFELTPDKCITLTITIKSSSKIRGGTNEQ